MMNASVKGTNLDLTPAIKDYIAKKMDMAVKFLGGREVTFCEVEVELTTNHHNKGQIFRAEANLQVGGDLLRAEKTGEDLYAAIDLMKDQLIDAIKKIKEKNLSKRREGMKENE